jgi:hypothetical protein
LFQNIHVSSTAGIYTRNGEQERPWVYLQKSSYLHVVVAILVGANEAHLATPGVKAGVVIVKAEASR